MNFYGVNQNSEKMEGKDLNRSTRFDWCDFINLIYHDTEDGSKIQTGVGWFMSHDSD